MADHNRLEFFFQPPDNLKPFGLSPGITTKKEVYDWIEKNLLLILTKEQPSPDQNNLPTPNLTEMVVGGFRESYYGFPLKGAIVNFHNEIMDKFYCVFEHGENVEVDFFKILKVFEKDLFGQFSVFDTHQESPEWNCSWNYHFISVSLLLYRATSNLFLIFSDKPLQRVIAREEEKRFAEYFDRQIKGST